MSASKATLSLATFAVAATLSASGIARASAQTPRLPATYTKVYESDSLGITTPEISPNGRWIVFTATAMDYRRSVWIVPAKGGKAERLLFGTANDEFPRWTPSGDHIVFMSSRASGGLMTLQIDRASGKPVGVPQRLTLEKASANFDISPDGKWLVYSTSQPNPAAVPGELKVIPAAGGPARSLVKLESGGLYSPHFTADGSSIEFVEQHSTSAALMKVATSGGSPLAIVKASAFADGYIVPAGDLILRGSYPRMLGDQLKRVAVMSRSGDTLAVVEPRDAPGSPRTVLVPTSTRGVLLTAGSRGPLDIRVVSTDGGTPRTVLANGEANWPSNWSADGKRIYYSPDGPGMRHTSLTGGDETSVTTPQLPAGMKLVQVSAGGRLLEYSGGVAGDTVRPRAIYDTKTNRLHTIAEKEFRYRFERLNGPGGEAPSLSDDVLYTNLTGDGVEIRSWTPDAPSRLIRILPKEVVLHSSLAVHGSRVVYRETAGDSTRLMMGIGATTSAFPIASIRGRMWHLAFSHDGRTLVAAVRLPGNTDSTNAILVVGLGVDGHASAPARLIATENLCGDFSWLPDDRSVLALCYPETAPYTRVLRFSLTGDTRPIVVTANEKYSHYGYTLSPDGKQIAYPIEREPRGSIWRVEIPGLAKQ